MPSFTKSIGGSYGSGPINAQSIGISQSQGGPVAGYNTSNKPRRRRNPHGRGWWQCSYRSCTKESASACSQRWQADAEAIQDEGERC
jgi:hypothetical protein